MNSKFIIVIIVVVLIIGGGFYLLSKNKVVTQNVQPSMSDMKMSPSAGTSASVTTTNTSNAVQIKNFSFTPANLTVKVGQKVTWTNQDNVGHSATADDNSFDTGVLAQGQSGSVTFSKPGTYTYHCSVHPNMHGTIIVQ